MELFGTDVVLKTRGNKHLKELALRVDDFIYFHYNFLDDVKHEANGMLSCLYYADITKEHLQICNGIIGYWGYDECGEPTGEFIPV